MIRNTPFPTRAPTPGNRAAPARANGPGRIPGQSAANPSHRPSGKGGEPCFRASTATTAFMA